MPPATDPCNGAGKSSGWFPGTGNHTFYGFIRRKTRSLVVRQEVFLKDTIPWQVRSPDFGRRRVLRRKLPDRTGSCRVALLVYLW